MLKAFGIYKFTPEEHAALLVILEFKIAHLVESLKECTDEGLYLSYEQHIAIYQQLKNKLAV